MRQVGWWTVCGTPQALSLSVMYLTASASSALPDRRVSDANFSMRPQGSSIEMAPTIAFSVASSFQLDIDTLMSLPLIEISACIRGGV